MEGRKTAPLHERSRALAAALAVALAVALPACDPPRSPAESSSSKPEGDPPGMAAPPRRAPAEAAAPPPASSGGADGNSRATTTTSSTKDPGAEAGPRRLAPLAAPGPFIELPIEGHPAAVVSVPVGATRPRPVVLATHGNFDRPEWQCQVWRDIAGPDVFVLCPRGLARRDSPGPDDIRFTYENNQALEREIRAGLDALRAAFPEHVDKGPVLYTGFSLGAITGVSIAGRDPALFPRAILVEGGHDKWTPAAVSAYAKGGGLRVLFACGQPGCVAAAKRPASLLEKAGVAARIEHGKGVGHSYDGAVAAEVKRAFQWVVEGDPRFAAAERDR
jgi:dienelactone hydrolase